MTRLLLLLAAALAAASLSACGRRGPLELPPEIQAQGEALKAAQAAETAKSGKAKPAPGAAQSEPPPPRIPGTIGNRPPEQYPFPLDPLL